jgi:hypothetical protein
MDIHTVLTHVLTYLAALALPLWLLGEQLAAWWTLRKPKVDTLEQKAHFGMHADKGDEVRKAA